MSTRSEVRALAVEMGWNVSTKRSGERDFYTAVTTRRHHYVTALWTPDGELETIWLDGVETSAAEFTADGRHSVVYLLAFVFDLKLAAEGSAKA